MKAVFVDIETTGLDFDMHVPIDIGIVVVDLNDFTKANAYTSCIICDATDWAFADQKALLVNGYTPENLIGKKDWEVGKEIEEFLVKNGVVKDEAFFICQNPSFDRPFFLQLMCQERMNEIELPYHWLDLASMFWIKFYGTYNPWKPITPKLSLSKDNIAAHFGIPPEEKPHKALNGAMHLMRCYKAVSQWDCAYPPGIPLD